MTLIETWTYSDHDMQCPGDWENGFKEARVMRFGDGERTLSHIRTGEWSGSTFSLTISDYDRSIRERLSSPTLRFWSEPLTVRMTDRPTRAAKGTPYTVFVGPIIEARPVQPLAWEITLGDIVSQGLLSDQAQAPWRRIGDGFLDQMTTVAEGLDLDTPEPIIYGIHRRLSTDAASPQGLVYAPTYLGTMTVLGNDYHVWLVAGHACADMPDIYVDEVSVMAAEGTDWFVPHASFDGLFGAPYVDLRSSTFGNLRRYTLVLGMVGNTDPDACAAGTKMLTVWVEGVEPTGNGTGTVYMDRFDQYKHFAINYVAHQGQDSYQSGSWLTTPTWDLFGQTVNIVDEASWDACRAIGLERFPGTGSPTESGYIGAAIIGAKAGERETLKRWIADWNRSCNCRFGITHLGEMRIVMLHPTTAIKAAAPLFEEVNDILKDSFQPNVLWDEHANRIPFKTDYNHSTGQWMTVDAASDDTSILNYNRVIVGETREYPFAPGITAANHVAQLELRVARYPPRTVTFETALGALATLDLGDYIRYRHFASIGDTSGEIRLAQIQRHQVQAGKRRVLVEALDVEDLIDFDVPDAAGVATSPLNDTCASALDVSVFDFTLTPVTYDFDTSGNSTDTSLNTSPGPLIDGTAAYHAAWFKFTAPDTGTLSITTPGSRYDTVLVMLEGTCGASPEDWTRVSWNDNMPPLFTSGATLAMTPAEEVYIVIYGYGPDDGGFLHLEVAFSAPV